MGDFNNHQELLQNMMFSGTTSKWGKAKLLPSAATPPCQLTSKPGQLDDIEN